MRTFAIWFEDTSTFPERASAPPAPGMREEWFDALTPAHSVRVRSHRFTADNTLSGALVDVPDELADYFCSALLKASLLLGTVAWIRDYEQTQYAEAWNAALPLFRREEAVGAPATTASPE